MKKYFIHFTAIVTMVSMLLTTSCQQVEKPFSNGKESTVTFTVSTPEMATRAVGDGTTATDLYYGVYNENGQLIPAISKTDQPQKIQGTTNVELVLVNSDTYSIVFWAENSESVSTIDWVNKTMTFNPTKANIEKYDAFYHYEGPFTVNGALNKEIKLTRPFAQLNIGTKDKTAAANAGLVVTSTQVTISEAADQMDLFTSSVVESTESQVYGYTEITDLEDEDFPVSGNEYLSMNYVLTSKDKQLVDVVFNYKNAAGKEYTRKYDRIPVQRNYRTNIYGVLLTDEIDYEVEIVPVFKDPAHTEFVFDGKNYTEVTTAEAANKAFEEGDMSVYLKSITADVEIKLPVSTQDVYLALGSTDKKVTVKYGDANGDKPAKIYVTLPEGDVEEMDLQLSSSTVYLSVNGKVETLTSSTAQNTLYIVNGRVENLAVAQGNVVIENYAGVNSISRTGDNQDSETKVFASETASLPKKEGENTHLIILGYPDFEETENGYNVYTLKGLKEFGDAVNDGNTFSGKQITLKADVDLKDLNWTSIGTEAKPFSGTFEGNGKTIKNLTIIENEAKEGKAFIGFFGYAKNATVKNVVFENVDINIPCLDIDHSQGHIGAVAGSLEGTSTIENVTVKGDVMVYSTKSANGASRVAVVAGGNSYGNVTMKNVHVIANEGSYLIANNNVGALAGQLQGKSVFENCSSNIDVTGTKFFAGGIIGLAAGDQLFTNCHTTGDITITAGREGRAHDQYRVGGIAGGWSDGAKNVCTLNGCTFKGVVSGKNSDGSVANPLDYAGYVGRGYTLNGCQGSKVIIDGVEYVQAFNTAAEAGIYYIDDILTINSATAFKLFAGKVNSGTSFEGKTIKLDADIDLNNEEWIPIGNSEHSFNGTFDGQGHRISNLTVNGSGKSNQGLFGMTRNGEIKNLTIENAKVAGRLNVGVVAGTPYTSKYTNINVIGHVEIEGMAYVGGVGGKNAYANWTNITVNVDETSYVRANSIEDGKAYRTYVGGVCGFNGEGGHTFENITSNIDVTGTTIDVGGLFGIAHYGNNFKNCSSSGDVEITNAENAADAEEIGGIAGVWHNADGKNVNFTDCSFTGNLKVNVEGVDLSDNTIVGNAYSTAGTGTLIIDGNTFVSEGVFKDNKGEFHVSSKVGLKYFSNKTADNGTVINLDSDIDFGNEEFQAVAAGYSKSLVFKGHGHIIKNIKLVQCTHNSVGAASMFFCYPGGSITVEGLVIDNATSKGATYAGTILGYTQGNARLSNITVQNSNIEGAKKIGGLVGFVEASTTSFVAENCHIINTSVNATEKQAGTILGYNAKPATLKQCTVDSKTTATSPNYCDGGIRCTDPAQAELTIE